MNLHNAEFIRSSASKKDFIRDGPSPDHHGRPLQRGQILGHQSFAGSEEFCPGGQLPPAKTSQVNYFLIDKKVYFVDLPGYGYARVSHAEKARWARLMEDYFADGQITVGLLIVDARHKPTADDQTMAQWFHETGCPFLVVANKLDKLKKSEIEDNLQRIRETLELAEDEKLIPFSAEKGTGKQELLTALFDNL